MANTASAKKAVRQIERRTAVNKSRRSQMRTFLRKVEEALAGGSADTAQTALAEAAPLDYTIEVSAGPGFTTLAASVKVQLTPQQQARIPLPILTPGSWYIWRIRPTFPEDGVYASSATFIIGQRDQ